MTRFYQITIAVLAICLVISKLSSCQEPPKETIVTDTVTIIRFTPPEEIHDTVSKKSIVFTPVFFNGNEVHDTIYRDGKPIAITPETYCAANLKFSAESHQKFKSGDSLDAKFNYPSMSFDCMFYAKPDTTVKISNNTTVTKEASRFGLYVGAGASIGADGIIRPSIHAGIGIRIY